MCKICDKIVGIPSDKKSLVELFNWQKDRDNLNDAEYFRMFMELNHDEHTKEPYAFIKTEIKIESTELMYGNSVDIKYCPFCGRKLYRENVEESDYLTRLNQAKDFIIEAELSISHKAMTKKQLEDKMFIIRKLIKIENLIEQCRSDIREG
ncbi:MAG: hypothetical protein ACLR0A_18350 [Faecalibacillus intestinalis]